MSVAECPLMFESIFMVLVPAIGTYTGFELTCLGFGSICSALYVVLLSLWIASAN